jgi:hypothetical protein
MLRRRFSWGALLALVAAALLWWLLRSGPEAGPQAAGPALAASASASSPFNGEIAGSPLGPASAPPVLASEVKAQSTAVSDAGAAGAGTLALNSAPTHWDLCGVGKVPIPAEPPLSAASAAERAAFEKAWGTGGIPPELPRHWGEDAVASLLARTIASLPQRGPRAQALANYLAEPSATRALLQQAERGGEAVVARWAVAACARGDVEPCAARAAHAWVRADPQNAAAWAELLQGDPVAEREALAGLTASKQYNLYDQWITVELLAAMPRDTPEYLQKGLVFKVSLDTAVTHSNGFGVMRRCFPKPPTGQLPPWCGPLVELMATQGDSHMARSLGVRLGARLGWPESRVKVLQAEIDRFNSGRMNALVGGTSQPFSCGEVRPLVKVFAAVEELGEYRAWMQHPAVVEAMAASAARR